jgi:hypothetical protein
VIDWDKSRNGLIQHRDRDGKSYWMTREAVDLLHGAQLCRQCRIEQKRRKS